MCINKSDMIDIHVNKIGLALLKVDGKCKTAGHTRRPVDI